VTFTAPLALIALVVIPGLAAAYVEAQRRRRRAAAALASPALHASVIPWRPTWRRHVAALALALGLVVLILAAAGPQRLVAVTERGSRFMLANDVSDSMTATDVRPTRLQAARAGAARFVAQLPAAALVGEISFARHPAVLQLPTRDHALVQAAIRRLSPGGTGTAVGETLSAAVRILSGLRVADNRRPQAAIVLFSDGGANVGPSPMLAARRARVAHIPVDVVVVGTRRGVIPVRRHGETVRSAVPVAPMILHAIARVSGGTVVSASDAGEARAIGTRLTVRLGERPVERSLITDFAGGALALVVAGAGVSMTWSGRLL
jgi:Ca-activated chloride channel family protein